MSEETVKRRFSVTLSGPFLDALDHLVEVGLYIDQQDVIRDAMRRLFCLRRIEPFMPPQPPEEPR